MSVVIRFVFVLMALLVPLSARADVITGRIDSIVDGATITLQDAANRRHTIRLLGIDAPDRLQAFGNRATSNLSAMLFDRTVTAQCGKRDRYGREVCKILLESRDINLEQIRAGMAWWSKPTANEQSPEDSSAYEEAQFWAQARRLGLWGENRPQPPWEFRHERISPP